MAEETNSKVFLVKTTLQIVFVAWLIVVNVLYYAQFRGILFARLGAWFQRWH
jgi:hypothetical protein